MFPIFIHLQFAPGDDFENVGYQLRILAYVTTLTGFCTSRFVISPYGYGESLIDKTHLKELKSINCHIQGSKENQIVDLPKLEQVYLHRIVFGTRIIESTVQSILQLPY
jgi:hypothetical protein